MDKLQNKTVLITGASRGIGEATARHFASLGSKVILAARSKNAIERITKEINVAQGEAHAITCDVSVYRDVERLIKFAIEKTGQIDVLVNNAGAIKPISKLAESDPEAWGMATDANYKGVYHGLRFAIPEMLKAGKGTIINISSGAATKALEGWSHYCSSKAAALSLTRCAHKEYVEKGIRVIGLSPGTVATDMQVAIRNSQMNPVSQLDPSMHIAPKWVAKAMAFLCGDGGNEYLGTDFSLKTNENRAKVGLPLLG